MKFKEYFIKYIVNKKAPALKLVLAIVKISFYY
jgi:hypothetical protein